MRKNDPKNNLECKFVHQNQNLCIIDPLTPHNAALAQAEQAEQALYYQNETLLHILVCQIYEHNISPAEVLDTGYSSQLCPPCRKCHCFVQ